jgi:hypothetical protein
VEWEHYDVLLRERSRGEHMKLSYNYSIYS